MYLLACACCETPQRPKIQAMDTLHSPLPLISAPRAGASWLQRGLAWMNTSFDQSLRSREDRFLADASDLADLEQRLHHIERHGLHMGDLLR